MEAIWAEQLYFLPLVLIPRWNAEDTDFGEVHGALLRIEWQGHQFFSHIEYNLVRDSKWIQEATTPSKIAALSNLPFYAEKGYTLKLI